MINDHTARKKSRRFALAIIIFAATTIAALTGRTLAGTVQVSGTHSAGDIKSHCDKAGGVFFGGGEGGYGCTSAKGEINCTGTGSCTGSCATCGKAAIAHKGDPILGVLSGTTLKAGTNAPTKTTAAPIRVRRPVTDSGGTSNTEAHQGKKK
jgi:hypothetical protein